VSDAVPYEHLTPDVIIDAVEDCGFECTGSILGLASYENRVYQIGVADGFVVAKFYRPGRWSNEAILEEHDFALELAEQDIPVVAPLVRDGYSLREQQGYRFAVYERRGGRWPELGTSWGASMPSARRAVSSTGTRSRARRWARARRRKCSTATGCRRISSRATSV
jgi:Ser/Thr protein kinase RdoA (MazF antagonist)